MIQFEADGLTLVDSSSGKTASWKDGQAYNDMLVIRDAQLEAGRENAATAASYASLLSQAQAAVNFGHDTAAPAKPNMKVVTDSGTTGYAPFLPPLADLVLPTVAPPPAATGTALQVLMGNATAIAPAPPSQLDLMYNMLLAMFRKEFPGA